VNAPPSPNGRLVTSSGHGLTAVVDPGRGAKILSLRDDSGREWLTQSDGSARGESFLDAEMAGWDECAPTLDACEYDGYAIPDHGDLWNTSFHVEDQTVRANGSSLPYEFARTIAASQAGLRFDYRAIALEREITFLWAAQPQFRAPTGTRVMLPPEVSVVFDVLSDPGTPVVWDEQRSRIDSVGEHGFRKFYVDAEQPVFTASLVHPDGEALTLSWSARCPYLGIWFDNAAYSREPVIALEPTTGYFDSLVGALATNRVAMLRAGEPLDWWIELSRTRVR
jgi:hypothetical protein